MFSDAAFIAGAWAQPMYQADFTTESNCQQLVTTTYSEY